MEVFLFMVCMPALCFILGTGILTMLYGRQIRRLYIGDKLITGFMTVLGMAEAAHLAAVFLGRSFSDTVFIFMAETAALFLLSFILCLWNMRRGDNERKRQRKGWKGEELSPLLAGLFIVLSLLIIYQIVTIMSGNAVFLEGDMTVETVESFIVTDQIYSVNPLTGNAYEIGIPLRIKIIGLPTLYGSLCKIFGISATELVWIYIPILALFLCYAAYYIMARIFWPEEKERENRMLFMVLAAIIFCVGDYLYGMDGFGLLHCGFRGVTLRNMILLPYLFGLTLRRRWRPVVLCILAEICIVWTLYGMGMCIAVTVGMAAICIWKDSIKRNFGG